jgi:hypothetical protein
MLAVKGIYDGKVAYPNQPVSITGRQEVIITFLEPEAQQQLKAEGKVNLSPVAKETMVLKTPKDTTLEERMKAFNSIIGIIKGCTMTLEEARAERLARQ